MKNSILRKHNLQLHADINNYPASTFWLKIGSSCLSKHQHFTQFNISVQVCLKFGLLFDHLGSAVCPMWWCWRAYSDGHVRSHNSGSQHWNSYFLTLVDLHIVILRRALPSMTTKWMLGLVQGLVTGLPWSLIGQKFWTRLLGRIQSLCLKLQFIWVH